MFTREIVSANQRSAAGVRLAGSWSNLICRHVDVRRRAMQHFVCRQLCADAGDVGCVTARANFAAAAHQCAAVHSTPGKLPTGLPVRRRLTPLPRFRSGVNWRRQMTRENTGFLLAQVNANLENLLTDDKLLRRRHLGRENRRKERQGLLTCALSRSRPASTVDERARGRVAALNSLKSRRAFSQRCDCRKSLRRKSLQHSLSTQKATQTGAELSAGRCSDTRR
jgi:hypothetical protein